MTNISVIVSIAPASRSRERFSCVKAGRRTILQTGSSVAHSRRLRTSARLSGRGEGEGWRRPAWGAGGARQEGDGAVARGADGVRRAVGRAVVDDEDAPLARIVLREQRGQRAGKSRALVPRRHEDADRGPGA